MLRTFFSLCFLFPFFFTNLFCDYFLDVGRDKNTTITNVKILSERCSGSNYTSALIVSNWEGYNGCSMLHKFGQKHFSPWFGYEDQYYGPKEDYTFEGSDNVLFVILFRDPYDWLRSFKETTFLGPATHQVCSFSDFIRMEWGGVNLNYSYTKELYAMHPLVDRNPATNAPFKNVIHLRTAKIKNFLKIRNKVKNYIVINYEVVQKNPIEVLTKIAEIFDIKLKSHLVNPTTIRGLKNTQTYVPKRYPAINAKDLLFINSQLDENLEKSIGYTLKKFVQ